MFPLFIFVSFALFLLISSLSGKKKALAAWSQAASLLKGDYIPGDSRARHKILSREGKHEVRVSTVVRGPSNNRSTYTVYRVVSPALPTAFQVSQAGFLDRVKSALGASDVRTGDLEFDARFRVQGENEPAIRQLLDTYRRDAISETLNRLVGTVVSEDVIRYERRGIEKNPDRLIKTSKRLVALADSLRVDVNTPAAAEVRPEPELEQPPAAAPTPIPFDTPVQEEAAPAAPPQVSLEELIEPPPALQEIGSPPSMEAPLEAPDLPLAEGITLPEELPAPPVEELPFEEPLIEPSVETPVETPAVEPPASVAPVALAGPFVGLAPLFQELFVSGRMGSEVEAQFDEQYAGKNLEGEGVLERLDTFRYDRHLGDGPGRRAILEVADPGGDPYARPIQVQLAISDALAEALESQLRQPLPFRGRMVGCEPYMQQVFALDGHVGE